MSDVTSDRGPAPEGADGPGPGRVGVRFRDPAQRTGFVQIENIVLFDRRLSGNDKVLYGVLKCHAIASDVVWPSQDRLAEMACISESTVRDGLNRLVAAGLLGKERRRAIPPSNIYSIEPLSVVYTRRALEFEAGHATTDKRRTFYADPTNWLVDPSRVSLEPVQTGEIQRNGDVSPETFQTGEIHRFDPVESGGTNRRDSSGKKMNLERDELEGGNRPPSADGPPPGKREDRAQGSERRQGERKRRGSALTKKRAAADDRDPAVHVPGSQYEKPPGYDLSKPASGGESDEDDEDEPARFTQVNQPTYAAPPIDNLGPRTTAVKPKPEVPDPKKVRDDEGSKVFALWAEEMREAYPDCLIQSPSNQERGMGKTLWDKYITFDADGKPNVDNLRKILRVAVWDWAAATDHEAFSWIAKPGTKPRFDAAVRAATEFAGFADCGILTRSHRMSRYFQRFLAKVEIPQSPAAVNPIAEIARREGKGIAVIHREILAGLRPDPRQPTTGGTSTAAG